MQMLKAFYKDAKIWITSQFKYFKISALMKHEVHNESRRGLQCVTMSIRPPITIQICQNDPDNQERFLMKLKYKRFFYMGFYCIIVFHYCCSLLFFSPAGDFWRMDGNYERCCWCCWSKWRSFIFDSDSINIQISYLDGLNIWRFIHPTSLWTFERGVSCFR